MSFTNVTSSSASSGIFFNANPASSVPVAYRAPPASVPNDVNLASQTLPEKLGNCGTKITQVQLTNSESRAEAAVEDHNLEGSKSKIEALGENDSLALECDPSKLSEHNILATDEEDVCPTCLEGNVLDIIYTVS